MELRAATRGRVRCPHNPRQSLRNPSVVSSHACLEPLFVPGLEKVYLATPVTMAPGSELQLRSTTLHILTCHSRHAAFLTHAQVCAYFQPTAKCYAHSSHCMGRINILFLATPSMALGQRPVCPGAKPQPISWCLEEP